MRSKRTSSHTLPRMAARKERTMLSNQTARQIALVEACGFILLKASEGYDIHLESWLKHPEHIPKRSFDAWRVCFWESGNPDTVEIRDFEY